MTASSSACTPQLARLYLHAGAWCARTNDVKQWLKVDFEKQVKIRRISTQGRHSASQWVTSYTLSYSQDDLFFDEYRSNGERKVSLEYVVNVIRIIYVKCNLLHHLSSKKLHICVLHCP